jgi:glyoxylase-like metal-dependent hydrolase (beta-lactamase superfamily II)
MSATLVYGDEDAILVDAWATYDQADALADWIETKGRRLSRVYITHGHGDHWLGLARLAERFPGVRGLATSEVLARVEFEAGPGMAGYWEGIFPGEVPTGDDKVLPELLTTDTNRPRGQRTADHPDRSGRHRGVHRCAHSIASGGRHRGSGVQRGAHDDR